MHIEIKLMFDDGTVVAVTPDPVNVYPSSPKEVARRLLAKAQP